MNTTRELVETLVKEHMPEYYFEKDICVNTLACKVCPVHILTRKAGYEYRYHLAKELAITKMANTPCQQIIKYNNQVLEAKKLKAILS
jgi:hypothetical protein